MINGGMTMMSLNENYSKFEVAEEEMDSVVCSCPCCGSLFLIPIFVTEEFEEESPDLYFPQDDMERVRMLREKARARENKAWMKERFFGWRKTK